MVSLGPVSMWLGEVQFSVGTEPESVFLRRKSGQEAQETSFSQGYYQCSHYQ